MPPRLDQSPKKKVRRKPAPKPAIRDAIYQRPKPKIVRVVVHHQIGQNAPPAPKVPQRPKPKVISDVSSTGGYDVHRAVQFRREARKATKQAHKGKSFDPQALRGAINTGIAPDVHEGKAGVFFVHKPRRLLPDTDVPVQPAAGKVKKLTKRNVGAIEAHTLADPVHSAALKGLEYTATPVHALAGVASGKSAGYGIKHKTLFGDVLHDAHVPAAGALGFLGDVVLDPTTYVSFGTGSVARKAAETEARRVAERYAASARREAEKLTRAGKSSAAVKRAHDAVLREGEAQVKKAAIRAGNAVKPGKGVTVKFAGKQAPGVTAATAAGGRVVRKVAAKAPRKVKRAGVGSKDLLREVRPMMRPAGVSEEVFASGRQAARQARSSVTTAVNHAHAEARGIKKRVGTDNYARVINAIETGKIEALEPELRDAAIRMRSQYRHAKQVRRRAGIKEGTIRDYFPHVLEDPLHEGLGLKEAEHITDVPYTTGKIGRKISATLGSSKERKITTTLDKANTLLEQEGRGKFSTDIPLVHVNYFSDTARKVAQSDLLKHLASIGRTVKRGAGEVHLGDQERVFRLGYEGKAFGLHAVDDAELKSHLAGKGRGGQYVALDRRVEEEARRAGKPTQSTKVSAQVLDKATRGFKGIATSTPGFHLRNLVGDTQMAYLSQPGHKLPRNVVQAGKALKHVYREENAAAEYRAPDHSKATIKVAGERQPVADFVAEARAHGVFRSGRIGREFEDLQAGAVGAVKSVRKGAGGKLHKVRRLYREDREDIMRLATYKHFRDEGMAPAQAADHALETHIDYGDLSDTERVFMRRIAPFYTFSARALPFHAKRLVQRPGKFANIEKAREEIVKGTGVDLDQTYPGMPEYQQRDVGIVTKIGGKPVTISDALPLNLLNELPVEQVKQILKGEGPAVGKYFDELGQFTMGLISPYVKTWPEMYSNRDFFFRKDIEDPDFPLVAAPSWVQHIPKKYWKGLGITPNYVDRQSGKKVWGWRGKADYAIKRFPGPFNVANQLSSSGVNRAGQDTGSKLLSAVVGVKVRPVESARTRLTNLRKTKAELTRQAGALNQQGIAAANATPEYKRLRQQINALDKLIYQTAKEANVKVLPKAGGPKKVRRRRPSFGTGLGGDVGGEGLGGGLSD